MRRREAFGKPLLAGFLSGLILIVVVPLSFGQQMGQESEAVFSVSRLVTAMNVEDREPVGESGTFAASVGTVYCFLEAQDIREDTDITFVWYAHDSEVASVTLPLRQGARWRTYSSKNISGRTGNWKVELQDSAGTVMKTVEFTVE